MAGLKTKIQETLRTMSVNAQSLGGEFSVRGEPSTTLIGPNSTRGKSGPRRRKRWRTKHPLREFRLMRGFTLEELAEKTDMSPSYLSRLESGSRRLNADIMHKLADALTCHPGDLLPYGNQDGTTNSYSSIQAESNLSDRVAQLHNLPLYHLASTPEGVQTIDFAHPTEWMARPSELSEVSKAYAVSMPTDVMSPRFYAGERLLAHPTKALTQRCFVIVTTKDDYVIVGQFIGWQSVGSHDTLLGPIEANEKDKLVLIQMGTKMSNLPGAEIEGTHILLPRHLISSIARVVGNMEAA